mgnify:CR=1 FL=1
MPELDGWLLDLFADPQDDLVLYFISEDGQRLRLRHTFPVTFYALGQDSDLRALWRFLTAQSPRPNLRRDKRSDVFTRQGELLYFVGRNDDMLKVGGMWVAPMRVEDTLLTHPAVRECAVTGGISGGLTHVLAHVVPAAGVGVGPELVGQLRRHAMETLPRYMCPTEIRFHEVLPRTATGKVQRFRLRQAAEAAA